MKYYVIELYRIKSFHILKFSIQKSDIRVGWTICLYRLYIAIPRRYFSANASNIQPSQTTVH